MYDHYQVLIDKVFQGDNRACYVERERILDELDGRILDIPEEFRYSYILKNLLLEVSTLVDENDVFLGRIVEELWQSNVKRENIQRFFRTNGHMTLDWSTLLKKGLRGIAEDAVANAKEIGTKDAANYAENVVICVDAIKAFCHNYAETAHIKAAKLANPQKHNLERAANALINVPEKPAETFFEALQSIWIIHMTTSCYIGSRDFGLGRMDQYLLPYYKKGLESGELTRDDTRDFLVHFMVKYNEITGTGTWNHKAKPIPCQATKQYVILGGKNMDETDSFNELSELFLEAAELIQMPEPVLTVRLNEKTSETNYARIAEATTVLKSQIHFFNDELVIPQLIKNGVEKEDALEYSAVGCCRIDIPGKMDDSLMKSYNYHNMITWMMETLEHGKDDMTFNDFLELFKQTSQRYIKEAVEISSEAIEKGDGINFHFESLLLDNCIQKCADYNNHGLKYRVNGHFFGGVATLADSFYSLKRLVFDEKRFSLSQLRNILGENFENNPELREEIVNSFPKFGNNLPEVDELASQLATCVVEAFENVSVPENHIKMCGFYSLDTHHRYGKETGATPDGRLAGEAVSENQSPVYGADQNGVTAALNSIVKLPLNRTIMGGLNVQFAGKVPVVKIQSLLKTYFQSAGLHVGFTFVNKDELRNAQQNPDKYRSLCVRMYGFSEYFTALSPHEQQEMIERTGY